MKRIPGILMEPADKGGSVSTPTKIEVVIPSLTSNKATPAAPKAPKAVDTPPPTPKPADAPPGAKDDSKIDVSDIPTDIQGRKTPAQYADERRKSKLDRAATELGVPELRQEFDLTKTQFAEAQIKLQKYEADVADRDRQLVDMQRIADERKAALDERESDYFERHQARFDPGDDEELRTSRQSYQSTMATRMPIRIPTAEGEKRTNFSAVLNSADGSAAVDRAMQDFAAGRQEGNQAKMDAAVNFVALQMGADVIFSTRPEDRRMLESNDPAFVKIEEAMTEALPSFEKTQTRQQYISEQAPVLAQQQIRKRETTIAGSLRQGIFLDPETRASIAAQNPHDGRVVLGMILDVSPQLKEEAERFIAVNSPALARMGEIRMPTLASKDPQAIAAHRQEAARYQRQLGEMTVNAAVGHLMGLVMPAIYGELEALRTRVGDIATNENPGGTRHTDDAGGDRNVDVSKIPTRIVPRN